jgi:hypothetical protein
MLNDSLLQVKRNTSNAQVIDSKLVRNIIKASKGQRDSMYVAARRMNLVNAWLAFPTVIASALLGTTVLTQNPDRNGWSRYTIAVLAFLNVALLLVQKVYRPGEAGEAFQAYGRKWEVFALGLLAARKLQANPKRFDSFRREETEGGEDDMDSAQSALLDKYNAMIEQSPLLPSYAFTPVHDELSSSDEEENEARPHWRDRGRGVSEDRYTANGQSTTGPSVFRSLHTQGRFQALDLTQLQQGTLSHSTLHISDTHLSADITLPLPVSDSKST